MSRGLTAIACLLLACSSDEGADPPAPEWACPAGWVRYAGGGCGPAELICAGGGGAAEGACGGIDPALLAGPACPREDFAPEGAGLASCPDGWPRRDDGVCDPGIREDCPDGTSPLPGGGCTPTGIDDCPAGEYADPPPGATLIVHVHAGADPAVADGSAERPHPSIGAAVVRAGTAGVVLVAAGDYDESLALTRAVKVIGVCAARVRIRGGDALGRTPAVHAQGEGARPEIGGVTIESSFYGVLANFGAHLTVRRSRLERCTGFTAIGQLEGTLELEDVRIADTLALGDGTAGMALQVDRGGHVIARRVGIERARDRAVNSTGEGSTVELEDVAIRETLPRVRETNGVGVFADGLGTVTGRRVYVDRHWWTAVYTTEAGSSIELEDLVVGAPADALEAAAPVRAEAGARLVLRDAAILAGHWIAFGGHGAGTAVEVEGCLVRGIEPHPTDPVSGWGVHSAAGAAVRVTRCRIEGTTRVAIAATSPGSTVTISDSAILEVRQPAVAMSAGLGMLAYEGGAIEATRVLVAGATGLGVGAGTPEGGPPGARLTFRDGVIRDVHRGDMGEAFGVYALGSGSTVELERALVVRTAHAGVIAVAGAEARVAESCVRDVSPTLRNTAGWGLGATEGATLTARRVSVERSAEYGVVSLFGGASVDLDDVIIRDVAPVAWGYGIGISAEQDAAVTARRVGIERVAGAALMGVRNDAGEVGRLIASDVFVRDVRSSQIDFVESAEVPTPQGARVAYGVHVAVGCELEVSRLVVDGVGFGFFAGGGTISLTEGVLTNALDAAGAVDDDATRDRVSLVDVAFRGNAVDRVVVRPDLPVGGALPPPSGVCLDASGCT